MKFLIIVTLVAICALVECKRVADVEAAAADPSAPVKTKTKDEKKKEQRDLEYNVKRCPVGWYRFENEKCFRYFPDLVTQADAEVACQALGSTLASLHAEQEHAFLKSMVLKETVDETTLAKVWIGLRKKANELYNFDLTPVSATLPWYEGHPAGVNVTGTCATLACDHDTSINNTPNFCKVFLTDCNGGHAYVCQKQLIVYKEGQCYRD